MSNDHERIRAVSYTHLDVYKRQSWDSLQLLRDFDKVFALLDGKQEPDFGLARLFETSFNMLRTSKRMSTDSVSYTHLDVYKRQSLTGGPFLR